MQKAIKKKSFRETLSRKRSKIVILLLIVIVIISSFYLFTSFGGRFRQVYNFPTYELIPIQTEDKPELKWWDMAWSSAYRIKVTNTTYGELTTENYAEFIFDHKSLVDSKKSDIEGNDLRVLYQNKKNEIINLKFNATELNTEKAKLTFNLAENLPRRYATQRYFLYFENSSALTNNYKEDKPEIVPVATVTEIIESLNSVFNISVGRKWYLKGSNLPQEYKVLNASVKVNPTFALEERVAYAEVENNNALKSTALVKNNETTVIFDVSALNPGVHLLKVGIDDYESVYPFYVSYPLYATWTMDWEGYDVKDEYLNNLDELANDNGMPITHFFNPRIYINNSISPSRRTFLTNWVKDRKALRGDEISMHLHMHYDFIEAAGLERRIEPSWGGSDDGYDVLTAAYPPEEFSVILDFALQQFRNNNLPTPVGYRAGGWFVNLDNLKVLPEKGFKYDSSGREYYIFGRNAVRGFWNLRSTTKPYKISANDQNSNRPPTINLWQFPNNGADSTNLKETEMIKRLNDNFNGQPLNDKQVITFLSHPHWFNQDYPRMKALFAEMNQYKAENDGGPVIYITLEEAYSIYNTQT
jgi:predicted deacetylase